MDILARALVPTVVVTGVLTGLLAGAALWTAVPALASCAADPRPLAAQVADADVAFVGTVVALSHDGRTARLRAEEIWKGPRLQTPVVHGGAGGLTAGATSVDRTWQAGERYLVFPLVDGQRLTDNACTPTRPWSEELAAARPADARLVQVTTDEGGAVAVRRPWVLLGATVAALIGGAVWFAKRRLRSG